VTDQFADLSIVLTTVPICILHGPPDAHGQNALGIRYQHHFVNKARLRFEGRKNLVVNRVADLPRFSGLCLYLDDHAGDSMDDLYDKVKHDETLRKKWAEQCGIGF